MESGANTADSKLVAFSKAVSPMLVTDFEIYISFKPVPMKALSEISVQPSPKIIYSGDELIVYKALVKTVFPLDSTVVADIYINTNIFIFVFYLYFICIQYYLILYSYCIICIQLLLP